MVESCNQYKSFPRHGHRSYRSVDPRKIYLFVVVIFIAYSVFIWQHYYSMKVVHAVNDASKEGRE